VSVRRSAPSTEKVPGKRITIDATKILLASMKAWKRIGIID
jgi:hypothetical protein